MTLFVAAAVLIIRGESEVVVVLGGGKQSLSESIQSNQLVLPFEFGFQVVQQDLALILGKEVLVDAR